MTAPIQMDDTAVLEDALERPLAVIYKHSTRCGVSLTAVEEVRQFAEARPDVPVYVVDVVRARPISMEVARRVGVPHESPQVILIRAGTAEWDASHRDVTREAIRQALLGADRELP